jgi:exodeoxyribonuclease VII large subunit
VSAIGHEEDAPLLDLVADVRASTPTDAARRIVPDVVAEKAALNTALGRARRSIRDHVNREKVQLTGLRSRPVFADPGAPIRLRRDEIARLRTAADSSLRQRVQRQHTTLASLSASLRALSPAATLDRGFAIVRLANGSVVRSPEQAPAGTALHLIVARGRVAATSDGPDATPTLAP